MMLIACLLDRSSLGDQMVAKWVLLCASHETAWQSFAQTLGLMYSVLLRLGSGASLTI